MGALPWNPDVYSDFAGPRLRPAIDLLARVELDRAARIADLGCGNGTATALLTARWPEAAVAGVDSSPAMLASARQSGLAVTWIEADLAAWQPAEALDLVFTNAALHWLADHDSLLPRLVGLVRPGGVLAVQMPNNFGAPSHDVLRAVARDGPWATALDGALREDPVGTAAFYYRCLAPHCARLDIWQTRYCHVLEGADPVLDWTRATALLPVLARLEEADRAAFEAAYAARLRAAYPPEADGRTLFPFKRLFLVATRRA